MTDADRRALAEEMATHRGWRCGPTFRTCRPAAGRRPPNIARCFEKWGTRRALAPARRAPPAVACSSAGGPDLAAPGRQTS